MSPSSPSDDPGRLPTLRSFSHWTREGTFQIHPISLGGSLLYRLWFEKDGRFINLGPYSNPLTAAESISLGEHDYDPALWFVASQLGIPPSPWGWNGLR